MRFFKAVTIFFSILAWLLLLAAVAVGFFAAYSIASCSLFIGDPMSEDALTDTFSLVPNGECLAFLFFCVPR